MSVGRMLKGYLWWTHERGSVPYDVMVTLILAFIFLTPRMWNYGDLPKPDWPANEVRLSVDPAGGLVGVVPVAMLPKGRVPLGTDLAAALKPVAGPVTVDRSEPVAEVGGRVVAWRVWAHR